MNISEKICLELDTMFDKLFSRRDVTMTYHWNSGDFIINVDGVKVEHSLEDILKMYDYVTRVEKLGHLFNSYETMIDMIKREALDEQAISGFYFDNRRNE